MAEDKDQTRATGTEQTGDDAAKAALAGNAAATDSDAGAEDEAGKQREDWKKRYLTEVTPALEEKNRLKSDLEAKEQRVRELEDAQRAAPRPPTADPQAASEAAELRELQELAAQTAVQAQNGDATSKLTLRLLNDRIREAQERSRDRQESQLARANDTYLVDAVEPDDEGEERPLSYARKRELRAFYERNKGQFSSLEAAHDAMLGRELKVKRAELAKAKKRVVEDTRQRETRDVIRTGEREVTAPEVKARKFASEAAYDAELDRLRAAGDEGGAYALQKARRNGTAIVNR